jgi:HAAS
MTMPDTHRQPLVADYLSRLDAAAHRLPADQHAELVDGIREHLDSALAGVDPTNEAQVRAVLDRLGAPEEIVAAAIEGGPGATAGGLPSWSAAGSAPPIQAPPAQAGSGPGVREIIAVVLLPIGGFILPVLGWFIGVVLLWTSDRWTTRDKIIGTFVWPGGYLLPFAFGTFAAQVCSSDPITGAESCSGWAMPAWLGVPVSVVLILAPLAVVGYLLSRARRSPTAGP